MPRSVRPFGLLLLLAVAAAFVAPVRAQYLKPVWQQVDLGDYLGGSNLHVVDLDGDGAREVVLGGGGWPSKVFFVLRQAGGVYQTDWVSRRYGTAYSYDSGIYQLDVVDAAQDGRPEVYAFLGDGTVEVYDGASMAVVDTLELGSVRPQHVVSADVDGDGALEFVVSGQGVVRVVDAQTLVQERTFTAGDAYTAPDLAVGDVDGDGGLEIVLSTGLLLDGATLRQEWRYADGFGTAVALADVDGDAAAEIVSIGNGGLTAFDGAFRTPLWQVQLQDQPGTLWAGDLEGDGADEILVASTSWGPIRCYDAATQQLLWQMDNPDYGVTDFAVGDPDNDGARELVWGAGHQTSSGDYLLVADVETRRVEWRSQDLDGPFHVVAFDFDRDRAPEVVTASRGSGSGYGSGVLSVFGGETHRVEWTAPASSYSSGPLAAADLDGDGRGELVVRQGDAFAVYDLTATEPRWREQLSASPMVFAAADVDRDGVTELVVGDQRGVVTVYDGRTQRKEWTSIATTGAVGGLRLADVDADDALEVVFFNHRGRIHVYDGLTHYLEWQSLDLTDVTALDVADVDRDGERELVAGRSNGAVAVLAGDPFAPVRTAVLAETALTGLAVANLDATLEPELLVAGTRLQVVRLADLAVLWESVPLEQEGGYYSEAYLGQGNSLLAYDVDRDQHMDVLVAGSGGVFQFEASARYPDTTPPEVTAHTPPAGLATVGLDAVLRAAFSEPLDPATLPSRAYVAVGDETLLPATPVWSAADSTVTLALGAPLPPAQTITVTFSAAIADPAGNLLDGNRNGVAQGSPADDFAWTFVTGTGIDSVGPVVHVPAYADTVWAGSLFQVEVVLTDTSSVATGVLAGAEAFLDHPGSPGLSLVPEPVDGAFDEVVDRARLVVATGGLAGGRHALFVRARDARGNRGAFREIPFHVAQEGEGSWVMYGFDAQHTGANVSDTVRVPLAERWGTAAGARIQGMVAVNDRVVVTGHSTSDGSGAFVAVLDAATGKERWRHGLGGVSVGVPAYGYGRVYVQTNDHTPGSFVSALDLETGELMWETPYAAQWSMGVGPTVDGGRVYTNGGYYGGMYGYDAFTGDEQWFVPLAQYDNWAPAVLNDTVYACVGQAVTAVRAAAGTTAWTLALPFEGGMASTSPVIDRVGRRLFFTASRYLVAVDLDTRALLWYKSANLVGFGRMPAYHGGNLYVVEDQRLVVYDAETGMQQWLFAGDRSLVTEPVLVGDYVFVASEAKTYAVSRATHQAVWTFDRGARAGSSLVAAGGRLFVLRDERLQVFETRPSGVGTEVGDVPARFALLPNYPNPFNPSTRIAYHLAASVHVVLEVFNPLGQHVATLVDAGQAPGAYAVPWDAATLGSGVYFCRLRAGTYTETRPMVLMK